MWEWLSPRPAYLTSHIQLCPTFSLLCQLTGSPPLYLTPPISSQGAMHPLQSPWCPCGLLRYSCLREHATSACCDPLKPCIPQRLLHLSSSLGASVITPLDMMSLQGIASPTRRSARCSFKYVVVNGLCIFSHILELITSQLTLYNTT